MVKRITSVLGKFHPATWRAAMEAISMSCGVVRPREGAGFVVVVVAVAVVVAIALVAVVPRWKSGRAWKSTVELLLGVLFSVASLWELPALLLFSFAVVWFWQRQQQQQQLWLWHWPIWIE